MAFFDSIFAGENGVGSLLLNMMGVSATFVHKGNIEYDPRTDTIAENTVTKNVKVSPLLKYSVYEMGTLGLTQEDSKVIGNGDDFDDIVNKQDYLVINGIRFVIIDNKKTFSGDKTAVVTMQVRKQ